MHVCVWVHVCADAYVCIYKHTHTALEGSCHRVVWGSRAFCFPEVNMGDRGIGIEKSAKPDQAGAW